MKFLTCLTFVFLLLAHASCTQEIPTDLTQTAFIPLPDSITATGHAFIIKKSTVIFVQKKAPELESTAQYLAQKIKQISGLSLKIQTTEKVPAKGIFLSLANSNKKPESYDLNIKKKQVTIQGADAAGCFYGAQTLLQTLPVKATPETPLMIATGLIIDSPEYPYRGAMLDVARHFFGMKDIKRVIDLLSAYKINVLHLHLADDQGWRIEIKSWPKLTEIGGSTQVGGGKGGFFTQKQYTEIVKYAQERQITIVPEIDMPGHTNAALASYAELNCDGKARKLYTGTKVGFSTLCTNKKITYNFIDDVIRELAAITPGQYIHIGGDESHSTPLKDYIPFINRAQKLVQKYDKKVIGWDEIAHATPVKDATVQFWANKKNTKTGVSKGAKVIMSPSKHAYLDMKYDTTTQLGLHWAGYIEVDKGYNWNPETLVPGVTKENIIGIEAPLWSETVTNIEEVEFMVFPRLPGYAEIGWTKPGKRNWETYKHRLAKHGSRFNAMDINFYRSPQVPWQEENHNRQLQ